MMRTMLAAGAVALCCACGGSGEDEGVSPQENTVTVPADCKNWSVRTTNVDCCEVGATPHVWDQNECLARVLVCDGVLSYRSVGGDWWPARSERIRADCPR